MAGFSPPFSIDLTGAQVLSLDVFDTSLIRQIGEPAGVFELVEQELARAQDTRLRRLSGGPLGFAQLRVRAEEIALRHHVPSQTPEPAVTLDDIYAAFLELGAGAVSREDVERLKALELECERRIVHPNPEILALARHAAQQGLQIAYLSDLYLPQPFILDLLMGCGYEPDEQHVFVSSSCGVSKRAGGLYPLVSQALNIPLNAFVHLGADFTADVEVARRYGLSAHYYPNPRERLAQDETSQRNSPRLVPRPPRSLALGLRDTIVAAPHICQHAPHEHDAGSADFWFRLGFERLGVLVLGFTLWLIEHARRDHVAMLLFLSREGAILKQCFDRVAAWQGIPTPAPRSAYVYASRWAWGFPALCTVDDRALTFLISGAPQAVHQYLDRCGLDPQVYERELAACGFQSVDDIVETEEERRRLALVFKRLHRDVLLRAATEAQLVTRYLDQLQLPRHGTVGLVDVGWLGSMQASFDTLMTLSGRECAVNGYYFGTLAAAANTQSQAAHGLTMNGYLTNYGAPAEIERWITQCVQLLELPFLASHGTCIGFEDQKGAIVPRLQDIAEDLEELDDLRKAAEVQRGIVAFLDCARSVIQQCPHLQLDPLGAMIPMAETMMDPTREEAERLGNLTQSDGFSNTMREFVAHPNARDGRYLWEAGYHKRSGR